MIEFKPLWFDATQKLYLLKAGADPRAALHPEQFREARLDRERRSEVPAAPDGDSWQALPREHLLAGQIPDGRSLRRLALTTDAGLGKTYNLRWMEFELSRKETRQFAHVVPIGSLSREKGFAVRTLVNSFITGAGYSETDRDFLERSLEKLRRRGEIALLFDGLDMANTESVDALAAILSSSSEWKDCRIVVAGRPFALEAHWEKLFSGAGWAFAQIAEFDAKQQRQALGKLADGTDRYDRIPHEARSILTTPRVLEYVRALDDSALTKLNTVSDVYWQACTYMLRRALGKSVDRITWERNLAILGALAFSMYAQVEMNTESGEIQPNLDRVHAEDMTQYLFEVLGRLEKTPLRFVEKEFLKEQVPELSRHNAVLNHGWFDNNNVAGHGEDLLWRNASLQEFFAAYWVTRWGSQEDAKLLHDWVVNPSTDHNRAFYWFWRYASEMPDDAISPGTRKTPEAWVHAMSPVFEPSASARSTEIIFRSWDRMVKWKVPAMDRFQEEFQAILAGKAGPDKQELARNLIAVFIPLVGSGLARDTGTFQMGAPKNECPDLDQGDNPLHPVTLSHFLLHRYCVTNVEYELFDPRHKDNRWSRRKNNRWSERKHPLSEKPGRDESCPAVNVSWYDAWCFAKWLGTIEHEGKRFAITLPTEAQWEYGCRCGLWGENHPFTFDELRDGKSCTSQWCNYKGLTWRSTGGMDSNDKYRGHTLPVNRMIANRWGFYQMHGNVWEWCMDWYASDFYLSQKGGEKNPENTARTSHRVLRGGCWDSDAWYCRSAYRFWVAPAMRFRVYGFRLAAVPALERGRY